MRKGVTMKKTWRKLITALCVASMLMTSLGVSVYAADLTPYDTVENAPATADELEKSVDIPEEDIALEDQKIEAEAVEQAGDEAAFTEMSEDPAEAVDDVDADVPAAEDEAEAVDQSEEIGLSVKDETQEETVGNYYIIGDGVAADFSPDSGYLYIYSAEGGTLWRDWAEKAGIDRSLVKTIRVETMFGKWPAGKVKLPADASGYKDSKHYLFGGLVNLTSADLAGVDTSNVTNMSWMFDECAKLTSVNLSSFNTAKVTKMTGMFNNCRSLKSLDMSKFNTSNLTDVMRMFTNCKSLTSLDLRSFNTPKLENMYGMFVGCDNLKTISLSSFNTSNVFVMSDMFLGCKSITKLDLRGFKTANVMYMDGMFKDCSNLKYVDIGDFDMSKVTDAVEMFKGCYALEILITPKNRKNTSECYFSHTMYDRNGKYYYQLPVNSPSMVLGKTKALAASIFIDVRNPYHAYYNAIYWAVEKGITKGYSDGTFGIDKSCTRGEMVMFLWRYVGQPAPKFVSKSPFKDVPTSHTFYKAILWAYQKGITKGYSDGTFGVNRNVSRGESMMFLWRLKGKQEPTPASVSPFKDVPKTHTFYKAILWGYQKHITTGYTSGEKKGTFGINENCTRGQIVTFLYRARNL